MERTIHYVDIAIDDMDEPMHVGLYEPTDGQGAMLGRAVALANRGGNQMILRAIALILDIIDALVVKDEDRLALTDAMVAGNLSLKEMTKVLEILGEETEQAPTTGPTAKKARPGGRR